MLRLLDLSRTSSRRLVLPILAALCSASCAESNTTTEPLDAGLGAVLSDTAVAAPGADESANDRDRTQPQPPLTTSGDASDATRTDAALPQEAPTGDAGPTPDAASAQPEPMRPCTHGSTRASQVVMLGDSFFHITEIPQQLWDNARKAGALGADESYRHYYFSGAMMAAPGLVAPIPTQWDDALAEDPNIKVVIMNGGGNDVLIADKSCLTEAPPKNTGCAATIENVRRVVRSLMDRLAKDGVEQVIYATYPHMPTFGIFQGDAPAINETIDYAQEISRKECEQSVSPPCVFVSTREAFEGHPDYINALDVHASPAGSKVAAELIWKAMTDHCIAQ